jgi:hypothetical protein
LIAGAVTTANGVCAPFVADLASEECCADRADQGVEKKPIRAAGL